MHIFCDKIPILAKDLWRENRPRHTYFRIELDNKFGEILESISVDAKVLYGHDNYIGETLLSHIDVGQVQAGSVICQLGTFDLDLRNTGMGTIASNIFCDMAERLKTGKVSQESVNQMIYLHSDRRFGETETKCLLIIRCPNKEMYKLYSGWYLDELGVQE